MIPFEDLVYQPIIARKRWSTVFHRPGNYGIWVTLQCGHIKSYPHAHVPKRYVHCVQCTAAYQQKLKQVHTKARAAAAGMSTVGPVNPLAAKSRT